MDEREQISRRDLLRGRALRRGLLGALGLSGLSPPAQPRTGAPQSSQLPQVPPSPRAPEMPDSTLGAQTHSTARPSTSRVPLPIHRPPGAVDEASFLKGCTRCGECMSVCPVSAIVIAPPRFREAAGTPMIDPSVAACVMCADTPCISVCEPGVLRADQPLTMARAVIQPPSCLAYNGSFCTVCSERCPVPGAIEVNAGRPRIIEDLCTGCGTCAHVCPAPGSAIIVMPLADRPLPK